jgi:hypothetical protein
MFITPDKASYIQAAKLSSIAVLALLALRFAFYRPWFSSFDAFR